MDLVREVAKLTSPKVTGLVFVAGGAFALRRPRGDLLIRELRRPKRAHVRPPHTSERKA